MPVTYLPTSLFDGQQIHKNMAITLSNGQIVALGAAQNMPGDVIELEGLLSAGFIDVQVNGGGGELFNNSPSLATVNIMSKAHARFGTTSMLPTLITDNIKVMHHAANAVQEARVSSLATIKGIHFEGPHLSQPKKGIHPGQHIRPISDHELSLFCRRDIGKVVVTLAPENVPCDVISDLVKQGVKICLGHSNADIDTTLAALAAGASGFTHLFNAMSPLVSRAPGMVGAALLDDDSYCGLIVDHHHVHKRCCQLAFKCKGYTKTMLVTDAMAQVGGAQDTVEYFGSLITRHGNKLTLPDGSLAGSALDMASAVRHCHQDLKVPLAGALTMASQTPAEFLGLDTTHGRLALGLQGDMVLLDDDLQVKATWVNGIADHVASKHG
ncbi:MAG: N-acetylglucosamine-6-phosphate deacetylase [Paraglaciecola sp.]